MLMIVVLDFTPNLTGRYRDSKTKRAIVKRVTHDQFVMLPHC